jgi:short-subunit dehydrogenase
MFFQSLIRPYVSVTSNRLLYKFTTRFPAGPRIARFCGSSSIAPGILARESNCSGNNEKNCANDTTDNSAQKIALIIGAGPGISIAFAKKLASSGYKVCLASRNIEKLSDLASNVEGGAEVFEVDCSRSESIAKLFEKFDEKFNKIPPSVVLYNPSAGYSMTGDCGTMTDYDAVSSAVGISTVGAYVAAQEAGKRMIPQRSGAIFITGATAGIKAYPKRSIFAMGCFGRRALAQSMYKELSPFGIHVCHFVIDGGVRPRRGETLESLPEGSFTTDAIATSYMLALSQPKGAWSWEIELRAKDEIF